MVAGFSSQRTIVPAAAPTRPARRVADDGHGAVYRRHRALVLLPLNRPPTCWRAHPGVLDDPRQRCAAAGWSVAMEPAAGCESWQVWIFPGCRYRSAACSPMSTPI
jgi:hypothetical protein